MLVDVNKAETCFDFPKLMRSKRVPSKIVLFVDETTGTQLTDCIGYYTEEWDITYFEDLPKGVVVSLQN